MRCINDYQPLQAESKAERRVADGTAEQSAAAGGIQGTPAAAARGGSPISAPDGTRSTEGTPQEPGRKEPGRRASFDARTPKAAKGDGKVRQAHV